MLTDRQTGQNYTPSNVVEIITVNDR